MMKHDRPRTAQPALRTPRNAPATTPPPPEAAQTRTAFTVEAVGRTDRGKVREKNEDQFLVARLRTDLEIVAASFDTVPPRGLVSGTLLVVADGMGGHPAGEHASALAISALKRAIARSLAGLAARVTGDDITQALIHGFSHADDTLARAAAEHPEMEGMGTTMTAAFVRGSELFLGHVGDSRAYLFRQGQLAPMTKDHTVATALLDAGVVSDGSAPANLPWSNVITNAVGGTTGPSKPDLLKFTLVPGDRLLLCTDGLTKMVGAAEIVEELRVPDLGTVADRLITRALARGGMDNVTVVVADLRQ